MGLSIAILVIGLLVAVLGIYLVVRFSRSFISNIGHKDFDTTDLRLFYASPALIGAGLGSVGAALFLMHEEWASNRALYMVLFILGLFAFGYCAGLLAESAAIRSLKKKKDDSLSKTLDWTFYISIALTVISFFLFMEGIAPFLEYPLTSGFAIGSNGAYLVSAANRAKSGDFHLAWYGVIIVFGAFVAYLISDARMYREYHKHGLLDIVILVAFPSGIIGARVWYVIGNFEREFANGKSNPIAIWDGGLTILGGALAGVIAGYLVVKFFKKKIDPRYALDAVVPTILLAQAIGRWGNFFNNEVYGQTVSMDGWMWLPTWIRNQMHFNGYTGTFLEAGMMNVPLFLIEALLNVAGFFIITFVFEKLLKKYIVRGDLTGLYFIYYGLVRVIMEPMRNSSFNMGSDNAWSVCNSLIYIVIGLGLCSYFHLHDYYKKKEDHKKWVLPFCSALVIFLGFFFCFLPSLSGGYTDGSNNAKLLTTYQGFEVLFGGKLPLLLIGFILIVLALLSSIASGLFIIKDNEKASKYLAIASATLSFVGICFFLFGQGLNSLPKVYDGYSVTYSLSYGFFLLIGFSAWGAALSIDYLTTYKEEKIYSTSLEDEENEAK